MIDGLMVTAIGFFLMVAAGEVTGYILNIIVGWLYMVGMESNGD